MTQRTTYYREGKLDIRRTALNRMALWWAYDRPWQTMYLRYVLLNRRLPRL